MKASLRKLFVGLSAPRAAKGHRPQQRQVRPAVENLERRDTPSVGMSADGVIQIVATNKGDQVKIYMDYNQTYNNQYDDVVKVVWTHNGQVNHYQFNLFATSGWSNRPLLNVTKIDFFGGKGADTVHNATAIPSILYGGQGNDHLFGGAAADHIDGGEGNDEIFGGRGNDILEGNVGSDFLFGEGGNDHLYAYRKVYTQYDSLDPRIDVINWNDYFRGTQSFRDSKFALDNLDGGEDNDVLTGGAGGMNIMHGGDQDDVLFGGKSAQNYLFGDRGNDYLDGGRDSPWNYLNGGTGADILQGELGGVNILDASTPDGCHDKLSGAFWNTTYYLGDTSGAVKDVFHEMSDVSYDPPHL